MSPGSPGHDVALEQAAVRSSIGLVFPGGDPRRLPDRRREPAVPRRPLRRPAVTGPDRSRPLLEMVGLADRADQQVRFYSGGMKRRLEIARGLLHLARGCCSSTDHYRPRPPTRKHIWDYVDTLRGRRSTTMFLTTHYMDEAERCDRIAIIDHGRIVAIDTPSALKASVGADTVTVSTGDDEAANAAGERRARAPNRPDRRRRSIPGPGRGGRLSSCACSTHLPAGGPQRQRAPPEPTTSSWSTPGTTCDADSRPPRISSA